MNSRCIEGSWKYRLALCLATIILLSACAQTTGDAILKSKNLIEVQGRYDQAIQLLEAELAHNPSSAAVWYWLGIGHFKKSNYDGAAKDIERAFELKLYETYHLTAYDYLGWSYVYTRQYDKAIGAFNKVLLINPNFASALLGRGQAALNMRDIDPAIDDLTRVLALQPQNVDAFRNRGWANIFKVRYQEALADFDQALRAIDPNDRFKLQDVYRGRGRTHCYLENFQAALRDFDQAFRNIDPNNRIGISDVYHGRGWTHYYLGDFQAAFQDFDNVLNYIDTNDSFYFKDAHRGKSFALLGLGRYREATASIAKAHEGMDSLGGDQDLSLMYYAMGDKQKAWEYRGGEGFMGVSVQDYAEGTIKGLRIVNVLPGSPAARAGLQPGDIITAVDYSQISNLSVFLKDIAKSQPGQSLTATILRDGRQINRRVTIASAESALETDKLIAPVLKAGRKVILQADRPSTTVQPLRAEPAPVAPSASFGGVSRAWAVVIGISKYRYAAQDGLTNLAFADEDARAFARSLETLGWNESHIKLLINEEALMRNIMIALESWLTKTGPGDLIVLFWSGHGFPDPEDSEKVYFACYDTDIRIPATGYRMDKVRQALEERRSRNVIVLADTCHAGKLITRGGKGVSIVPQIDKMRREQAIPKGWIFMVGADSDRQAIEHSSWTNGAFTHTLLKGLGGEADGYESIGPKDGVVTMGELRGFLNSVMPDETQRVLGVAKRPVITTSAGDPDIWDLSLQIP